MPRRVTRLALSLPRMMSWSIVCGLMPSSRAASALDTASCVGSVVVGMIFSFPARCVAGGESSN